MAVHEEKKSETVEEEEATQSPDWIDDFEPLSMDDYLDSDPVDNHGDASFTGVWTAAKGVVRYLQKHKYNAQNVLELGAGTGWLGITMARNCPSLERLVLTDSSHTGAATWTQQNVDAAKNKQELPNMDRVQVEELDWTNEAQAIRVAQLCSFDLMLGTDLIYSEDRIQPLAKTIAILLEQQQDNNPRFLYGHTKGRMPEMDQLWEEALAAQGLAWKVLERIPQWDERMTVIMDIFRQTEC